MLNSPAVCLHGITVARASSIPVHRIKTVLLFNIVPSMNEALHNLDLLAASLYKPDNGNAKCPDAKTPEILLASPPTPLTHVKLVN